MFHGLNIPTLPPPPPLFFFWLGLESEFWIFSRKHFPSQQENAGNLQHHQPSPYISLGTSGYVDGFNALLNQQYLCGYSLFVTPISAKQKKLLENSLF